MKPYQNNYAFIDSQNLNLSIRDQGWKLDYEKFRIYLKKKHKVNKAILFLGYIKENKRMYKSLEKNGFKIIFKPTSKQNGKVKGNIDAELVLHCVINLDKFTKAVIVTGDGDFYCLVDYLSLNNKLLKLLIPNKYKYSGLFKKHISKIVFISDLKDRISFKQIQK